MFLCALCFYVVIMKNNLDQFYTRQDVALLCWNRLGSVLDVLYENTENLYFIEPSAGGGSFYRLMPCDMRLGVDLQPMYPGVIKQNFLTMSALNPDIRRTVTVGNPPFGKRAGLAVEFFNHACRLSDTVAFILPIIFQKFIVQRKLDLSMNLIDVMEIPRESFELKGKPYSVNTIFQVWTRLSSHFKNLRQYESPPIHHIDFQMWQYNNTQQALKFFNNDFDFAVPCQGWQDYTRRETQSDKCEKHKQWMLLKAKNNEVLCRLINMDYEKLSQKYTTSTPGFRKGDLVKEYTELFDKRLKHEKQI